MTRPSTTTIGSDERHEVALDVRALPERDRLGAARGASRRSPAGVDVVGRGFAWSSVGVVGHGWRNPISSRSRSRDTRRDGVRRLFGVVPAEEDDRDDHPQA